MFFLVINRRCFKIDRYATCGLKKVVYDVNLLQILKELWKADIKSSVIETNSIEESIETCSDFNIPLLITLRDTDEKGTVRIQYWDKERYPT